MSDTKNPKNMLEQYNIGVCLYPPQENRSILPDAGATIPPNWVTLFSNALPDEILLAFDRRLDAARTDNTPLPHTTWAAELANLLSELTERVVELRPFLTALQREAAHDPLLQTVWNELEARAKPEETQQKPPLAQRERQVLELAASGDNNVAIAKKLGIQPVTVTKALSRAYAKLGAKNRGEAIFKWLIAGAGSSAP